jgi:hypothetical protein
VQHGRLVMTVTQPEAVHRHANGSPHAHRH